MALDVESANDLKFKIVAARRAVRRRVQPRTDPAPAVAPCRVRRLPGERAVDPPRLLRLRSRRQARVDRPGHRRPARPRDELVVVRDRRLLRTLAAIQEHPVVGGVHPLPRSSDAGVRQARRPPPLQRLHRHRRRRRPDDAGHRRYGLHARGRPAAQVPDRHRRASLPDVGSSPAGGPVRRVAARQGHVPAGWSCRARFSFLCVVCCHDHASRGGGNGDRPPSRPPYWARSRRTAA